jgi:hypothetical protein
MKFNGVCGYCKKTGHSEENCWHKNAKRNNHNGNFTRSLRPCKLCGGSHMDHKCWELPSNANKRPKNWKSKIGVEAANIAHDGRASTNVELLLSNMDEHMNYGQNRVCWKGSKPLQSLLIKLILSEIIRNYDLYFS